MSGPRISRRCSTRLGAALLALATTAAGCSGDDADSPPAAERDGGGEHDAAVADDGCGPDGRTGLPAGDTPSSACNPRIREHDHDCLPAPHVAGPLPASSYNSSPPSSGPHCPRWGRYTAFDDPPLPACNFLHNLEHGAIALLYDCPDGCADVVEQLAQVVQTSAADPDCGNAKRVLITPYADMDATVAAAAWGYTFTADCLDDGARAALLEFIATYLGSAGDAPEPTVCNDGTVGP